MSAPDSLVECWDRKGCACPLHKENTVIPDKLVTAAAKQFCRHFTNGSWGHESPCNGCVAASRNALAAAFAALPECEEAVDAMADAMTDEAYKHLNAELAAAALARRYGA